MNGTASRISRSTGSASVGRQIDRLFLEITIVSFEFVQVLAQLHAMPQRGDRFGLLPNRLLQIRGAGSLERLPERFVQFVSASFVIFDLRCGLVSAETTAP